MLLRAAWLRRLVRPSRIHLQHGAIAHRRDLSTLDSARVNPADYMDLSGYLRVYGARFALGSSDHTPFPSQTHGFFYYVPGPAHAPIAGEVRFRIAPTADPTGFQHGHDLLLHNSPAPWRVPLISIIQSKSSYIHLYERLCKDGIISSDLVADVREHKSSYPSRISTTSILHSLSQPFHHEVSKCRIHLCVAKGHQLSKVVRMSLPIEYPKTYLGGHILCHLEALVHEGRQALALRVLETFQLEQKTHKGSDVVAPVPIAGELLRTAAGDVWTLVLRDEIKGRSVLHPLLSDLPLTGYISRSTRQRSLRQLSGVRIRTIENVVPGHLTDTDWMDFSLLRYIDVQFADPAAGSHTESTPLTYDNREPVFPEGTTGFLYVHVPDPAHPIGAQLRFRLVSEPNPAGFASGRDLHRPNGEVWYCWLPTLVRRASGQAIASIVTRQGLVDRGVVEQWQAETGAASCVKAFSPLVCPGSAPFSLDLSRYRQGLIVGAGMRARFVQITSPFAHQRLRVKAAPFSGRALVQLEENPAQKTYNMRVLEVSDLHVPPAYDGPVPIPKLGVFQLRSGRKLWTTMQKMLAEQR